MSTQLPYIQNTEPERSILDSYRTACALELNKTLDLPLEKAFEGVHVGSKNGDFHIALPRFRLPGDVKEHAQKVHDQFKPNEYIDTCIVKQGFVTFQATTKNFIRDVLDQIHTMSNKSPTGKPEFGTSTVAGQGKHVIIEFSSPNIAKPFHAGHLRSTIIGAFLANLYEACGWKVTRMNYLGDWGKQFGLLGVGFERYGSQEKLKADPIAHLFEVYVRINTEAKEEDEKLGKKAQDDEEGAEEEAAPTEAGNTINDQARRFFKRMEDGEEGPLSLWKQFRDLSIEKYKDTYARLNIHFDVYSGESQISQENQNKAIDVLTEKGLIKQSGQSQIIDLEEYKLGKAVVKKMDGTTLYLTRDFAAAAERYDTYHFDKMIYVIASQQDLHTAQLFKAMDLIGYDWAKNLLHINFGMVLGMSTRKGTAVFLDQILNEAKSVMMDVMKKDSTNKYDQLEDPEWTADTLGLSAVKIQDMGGRRIMNYKFAWDRMTSFEGDTGPYLQYAHVRISSIQRKVADETVLPEDPTKDVDTSLLTEPKARELVYLLSQYPDVVKTALKTHEPNNIVSYAFQLTHVVSSLLEILKVKGQEQKLAQARLYLFMCAKDVLGSAMRLLTLTPLEKM
ncbi:arginyl-tRNA synthetase [Wallemia mellicola CBS 633.66]|uniref:arginine--tRNA ligase n=1 Tax=Wallemia mellicola (strain ATCC MYA-4683 / CBS 633.66) TaxID=671144 RepID=I4Y534_WALMC|nr:arginyl-tRNA synthetase [Wallemia mellicola CBS 633.66]EIM19076.1 arginyl-tRNA synthetase [Wallemia mellicola CBS 633.66]|eukprot:XP_006960883.1 arginyl-tRNA synthetase [Wallemia mellicola CBS 633.66]